jgi:hypothetical protein
MHIERLTCERGLLPGSEKKELASSDEYTKRGKKEGRAMKDRTPQLRGLRYVDKRIMSPRAYIPLEEGPIGKSSSFPPGFNSRFGTIGKFDHYPI